MLKICRQCKLEFPATKEYFVVDKRNQSGLGATCRECEKKRVQQHNLAHPEQSRERQRRFEEQNPGRITELKYRWKEKNPNKVKETKRRHRQTHREKTLANEREYKDKNREQIREKDRVRSRQPQKLEEYRRHRARREARLLELPATLTKSEWLQAIAHWHGCCVYCGKQPDSLTLDHYIPLVNPNCPGTVATNILPACLSCNSSKNNAEAFYWMSWKFGVERANEIIVQIQEYFDSFKAEK